MGWTDKFAKDSGIGSGIRCHVTNQETGKKMMKNRLGFSAVAVAVAAVFGGMQAAVAQEAAEVTTEDVKVTAGRVEQELLDVNMAVTVITREDIEKSAAQTIGELLQDVPGVQIENDGGQGLKRVSIRGEDAYRTLVMIDGQKISEHKSMSGAPMLIDPNMIERIEVIKGPASVLYGSDAIGGAINIITKKGGDKPFQADVSVGFDTKAKGRNASASIYGAYEGWKYRLSLASEDAEDLKTPKGTMPNTNFNSRSVSGFLSYDINPDATVGVSLDYFDLEFHGTSIAGSYDSFAVDVPKWERTKFAAFGELRNVNDYLTRVRADAFYQVSKKDMTNTIGLSGDYDYHGSTYDLAEGSSIIPLADNETKQYGFSLQTDWQLGEMNYLIAGYEFSYEKLDAKSDTYMDFTTNSTGAYYMDIDVGTHHIYDAYQMTNAIYAQMQTELPYGFTLNYGARATWVNTDMDDTSGTGHNIVMNLASGRSMTLSSFDPTYTTESSDTSDHKVIFNIGLLWTNGENLTGRFNFSQGYRSPLLQELYTGTSMGGSTVSGNPNLRPETSDNFEIGLRYQTPSITVDAAAFYAKADNYITALLDDDGASYTYQNVGEATTYGLELSASWRIANTGFEPYASLTLMRRKYNYGDGVETYKTMTPKLTARYGVRWHGEYAGLGLRTDVYARSRTKSEWDGSGMNASEALEDYPLSAYTTFNITGGVSFGPRKQYSLDAGFYNIFNKAYREQTAIYEPGRYFALKLNAHF